MAGALIADGFFRERNLACNLTSNLGYADRKGTEAIGRAGALFDASDAITLHAAGYTGFRLPTLNELYRPFVVFPVTTQANAALGREEPRGMKARLDRRPAH